MKTLFVRTDSETAIVGVFDGDATERTEWQAGRELSKTILKNIDVTLKKSNLDKSEIEGVIFYKGPGSFTGLRIGAAVASTVAMALDVPIVATNDDNWLESGLSKLKAGENDRIVEIEYGAEANTTKPKK